MSKKYIISSLLILAVIFSLGTKVSAQVSSQDVNDKASMRVDSTTGAEAIKGVTVIPSAVDCKKVDADANGKFDAQDFAAFQKIVAAGDVKNADMDGNGVVNANDFQTFINAYASCTHRTNTGVVTGGIKPAPAPIPTSDDAVVNAQLEKCKTLGNDVAISNCIRVIKAKFPIVKFTGNQNGKDDHDKDQKDVKSEDRDKDGDEDQVGGETPEQIKNLKARYEQRLAEFNALYTRLSKLADLIDGRIAELSAKGVNVTNAKARLASARTYLGYARFGIDSTMKIYQTYGPTSNVIRSGAENTKAQLVLARNNLIAATRYLSTYDGTSITDACKKFDANGDNSLTTDDFATFDAKFKAGDKSADADMNGTLNANDYQAFTNGYARCHTTTDATSRINPATLKPVNTKTEPSPVDMKATVNTSADTQSQ